MTLTEMWTDFILILGYIMLFVILWYNIFGGKISIRLDNPFRWFEKDEESKIMERYIDGVDKYYKNKENFNELQTIPKTRTHSP